MGRSATLKPFKVAGRIKPWCVSIPPYLSSTAKRQRLYFATRDDALRECDRLRVRKDNFGISLTSMTASRIAEAAEVYNLLAPYGVSLLEVGRDYLRRHNEKTASRPWRDVFEEYFAMPKKRCPEYFRALREADMAMRDFRDKLIVEITPQDINKALSGFAQSSRNAKLRIFRAVFNLGIKRGYLTLNPVARLDFAELETKEVEVFSVEQTTAFLNVTLEMYPELVAFYVFAFFCGIRPNGELEKLDWSDVHLAEKQVVIRPRVAKTKRRRFVDISDNALAWLQAYALRGGSFTGKVRPCDASLLTNRRRILQKQAGIEKWIQQGARHSYCSYWLAQFEDVNRLVLQSGHTDADSMWEHYHRAVTKTDAKRYWSIRPPGESAKAKDLHISDRG
jgi:integrase